MAVKQILIDTNGYTAFKQGTVEAIEVIQHAPSIGINSVVLGELLGGFAVGTRQEINQQELSRFLASPRVTVFDITANTATHYAHIYQALRQKGRPIPVNDMWIAASALEHGCALYTYDHHFNAVDDLAIVTNLNDMI